MPIKSVCNTKVVTIKKSASLEEVAHLMQKHHVGSVVVVEPFDGMMTPSGMITDRDIALTIGLMNPKSTRVEQIMQSQPITVSESDGIFETIVKMNQYGIRRMPVVYEDGSLCGVVSADDLFSLIGDEISKLSKITEIQQKNEKGIKLPVEKHV